MPFVLAALSMALVALSLVLAVYLLVRRWLQSASLSLMRRNRCALAASTRAVSSRNERGVGDPRGGLRLRHQNRDAGTGGRPPLPLP